MRSPRIVNACKQPAIAGDDMHPARDVRPAEQFVRRVYEAIRNSTLWPHSALIVLFDEHGGFFDHVTPPPGVDPGDGPPSHNGFTFDQLGVRVPCIVISPWVKKNGIDHTHYDHTSVVATVTRNFGLRHLTDRDAAANDLLHLFSNKAPRSNTLASLQPFDTHALDPRNANTWLGDFTGAGDGLDEMLYFDGGLPSVTDGLHIGNTHDWWIGRWRNTPDPQRQNRMLWTLYPQFGGHPFNVSDTSKFAVYTGRFSGGTRLELIVYAYQTGQWWLARFVNGKLNWTQVATSVPPPFPGAQPKAYVGRFTTNTEADELAVYRPLNSTWTVGRLNGNTLTFGKAISGSQIGNLHNARIWAGDFAASGTSSLLVYQPRLIGGGAGSWWHLALDGSNPALTKLQPQPFGLPPELYQLANVPIWPGDFEGSNTTQLLAYTPAKKLWWAIYVSDNRFIVEQIGASLDDPDFHAGFPPLALTGNFDGNSKIQLMYYNRVRRWMIARMDTSDGLYLQIESADETNPYGDDTSAYPFWAGPISGDANNAAQLMFFSHYTGHWSLGTNQPHPNQSSTLTWTEGRHKPTATV